MFQWACGLKAIEVAVIHSNLFFLCCDVVLSSRRSRDTLCLQMSSFPSSDEFQSCCDFTVVQKVCLDRLHTTQWKWRNNKFSDPQSIDHSPLFHMLGKDPGLICWSWIGTQRFLPLVEWLLHSCYITYNSRSVWKRNSLFIALFSSLLINVSICCCLCASVLMHLSMSNCSEGRWGGQVLVGDGSLSF